MDSVRIKPIILAQNTKSSSEKCSTFLAPKTDATLINYLIHDGGNSLNFPHKIEPQSPPPSQGIDDETIEHNNDDNNDIDNVISVNKDRGEFEQIQNIEFGAVDGGEVGDTPSSTTSDYDDNLMPELDSDLLLNAENSTPIMHVHMNIQEPLSKLRFLLEQRLGLSLVEYIIYLQGNQMLENEKNLVEQCVNGEGLVQINVQIEVEMKRINILDVLKPADEYLAQQRKPRTQKSCHPPCLTQAFTIRTYNNNKSITSNRRNNKGGSKSSNINRKYKVGNTSKNNNKGTKSEVDDDDDGGDVKQQPVVQWQVDLAYRKEQDRLKIPHDSREWSVQHVRHWIQWAVRQFNLVQIKLSDWSMSGAHLNTLTLVDFQKIVPRDPGDIFWTHFELLRKMKVIAVKKEDCDSIVDAPDNNNATNNETPPSPPTRTSLTSLPSPTRSPPSTSTPQKSTRHNRRVLLNYASSVAYFDKTASSSPSNGTNNNNRSGNGQIQLWQFLLELLTDKSYKSVIYWTNNEGEFKLDDPQLVAQLWGERKNKPNMNYEKLSRALRYYYDGDMISKVQGERFVYKFVCDLKDLLGYSAEELFNLTNYGNPFVRLF